MLSDKAHLIIFIALSTLGFLSLLLMIRLRIVLDFRIKLIEDEFEWMKAQTWRFKVADWRRRWKSVEKISQLTMALKFWVPLKTYDVPIETFYPESKE